MAAWVVERPAYTAGPFPSQAAAETFVAHVDKLGACMFTHEAQEVTNG